ncbi:MAG: hypothetical protein AB8B99_13725 [Phormidesmis sp.]
MKIFNELSNRQVWRLLIVVAICWGCLLRFYALGEKVYWEDEAFTSLRLSGYSDEELVETIFQGEIVYPEDLLQFQITHADKNLGDTVNSLANDTHPPGYFVLLRLWVSWFGLSIASIRSLSAVVSLLLLPGVFGMAWMLFEQSPQRRAIAELATALVAVSPYQITLANEARMYSLLPVATTLAGLCLLRAVRLAPSFNHRQAASNYRQQWIQWWNRQWVWYGLASAASLYVHWLAIPILAGYGLYVRLQNHASRSWHWVHAQKRYLLTTAFTLGAVVPWFCFMGLEMGNVYTHTQWAGRAEKFWGNEDSLGQLWLHHGLLLFVDGDIFAQAPLFQWIGGGLAISFVIGVFIYLVRHTALPVWSFLLISSGIIYTPLAIVDILLGGRRSGIFRYFSPSIGAIEISVAFCLVSLGRIALLRSHRSPAEHIAPNQDTSAQATLTQTASKQTALTQVSAAPKSRQRKSRNFATLLFPSILNKSRFNKSRLAQSAIVLLLLGGGLSQTIAKATYSIEQHPAGYVASMVNDTPGALLISDAPRPSVLLPLAHLLKAETPLMLTVRPDQPVIEDLPDRPVFLYLTSENFRAKLEKQGQHLRPIDGVDNLFSMGVNATAERTFAQQSTQVPDSKQ